MLKESECNMPNNLGLYTVTWNECSWGMKFREVLVLPHLTPVLLRENKPPTV